MKTRVEFRTMKSASRLTYLRDAIINDFPKDILLGYIDECLYRTADYMRGTTKMANKMTQEELSQKRAEFRKNNIKYKRQDAIKKANEALKQCKEWK